MHMTAEPERLDPHHALRGMLVRGGTSKCWLFHRDDMPDERAEVDRVLIDALGARDPRQIDGVGGGTSTTSKIAVVARSSRSDIDVEYEFGQVGIGEPKVEWYSDCGNCATAIALFAVSQGLVRSLPGTTRVVMRNTNTGTLIECEVDTPNGMPESQGEVEIPGVSGTGNGVRILFRFPDVDDPAPSYLPTGRPCDELVVEGRRLRSSLVIAGAPVAVFDAADLDATAVESLSEVRDMVPFFTAARQVAARAMGSAIRTKPGAKSIPKVGVIGRPRDYRTSSGTAVDATSYDLALRMVSMDDPHPAVGLTTAAAIGAASVLEDTLVHRILDREPDESSIPIRIGTASGVVSLRVTRQASEGRQAITVELERSARVLCEAVIVVRSRPHP